jgi:ribokinase
MNGKVVVVGSMSRDLVYSVPRRPGKGETLIATDFQMYVGGKGNNQAMAAARAGAHVSMVGRIGEDANGDAVLACLHKDKVDTKFLFRDKTTGTGIANIYVDEEGDNSIVIATQANGRLSPADVEAAWEVIAAADVMLLQLEVPLATTIAAAKLGKKAGIKVIVNPAPAPSDLSLFNELLPYADLLVPNQSEAELISLIDVSDAAQAPKAAARLQDMGGKEVLITLAEQGAFYLSADGKSMQVPAFKITPKDTTAAGDAFCGALSAAISRGTAMEEAIRFACSAGALATTICGAEPSLPQLSAIEKMLGAVGTK